MHNPTDNQTPQPVDELEEILKSIFQAGYVGAVEYGEVQLVEYKNKTIEEAKARLLQWGTIQVIKELQNQRIRFEVPEEELGINGYPRPGAAGRNALKRKELHYLDKKIAELQASLKDGENQLGEKS